jgi:hypothetical protein
MSNELERWISVYELSTGRRVFALEQMREAAREFGFTELVAHIEAALAHDRQVVALDAQWDGRHRQRKRPQSMIVDRLAAQALTGLRQAALAQTRGAAANDPIHAQVRAFLQEILPAGVFAVATLPQVEEQMAIETMVGRLQGDLAKTVAALGLTRQAARLAELSRAYAEALDAQPTMRYPEVQAARQQGQEYLLEAIAMILGRYYKNRDPDHAAARAALLAPIAKQNAATRAQRRARRARNAAPDAPSAAAADSAGNTDAPAT